MIVFSSNFVQPFFSKMIDIMPLKNLGIFSESQPRIHFVKSQYNTFRGVNWKILRLSKVLLQFTEKGGDGCMIL
jgi:hypothetical protein